MQIVKDIANNSGLTEKQIAEIMKAGFFLGRDCPNFEVAAEIVEELDTFIY